MTKRPKHNRLQQTGAMSRHLRISRSKSPLESTSALAKIGRSASKDPPFGGYAGLRQMAYNWGGHKSHPVDKAAGQRSTP